MKRLPLAAIALAGIILLSGCATAEPATPEASPEASAGPAVEEESPGAVFLSDPGRISPEEVAAMTQEELQDFVTITVEEAPTPEAFAREYVKVYDAWMNSGATAEEFAPYDDSAKGVYEAALGEKYNSIFMAGLYAEGLDLSGAVRIHESVLNGAQVPFILKTEIPFSYATVYSGSEVQSDYPDTQSNFAITVSADIANNNEESGVSKFTNEKNVLNNVSWELVVANFDGVLKVTSVETISA